uniref:Dynein regulatory complex protein 1 n=1 Tax=Eptatretus burgeri TaxID=7764 RepID=A0A8C4NBF5_EPTBU
MSCSQTKIAFMSWGRSNPHNVRIWGSEIPTWSLNTYVTVQRPQSCKCLITCTRSVGSALFASQPFRIEKLQAEAQEGQEHFEMISRTWCASETSNVPHELHGALCNQQQECLKFIGRKNHVIDELRQELNMRDESCVQCLKQQAEDITLIIERAEHRTQDMMLAQQEELENIEKAFEKERQDVLLANKQEWEQRMKSLKKCEVVCPILCCNSKRTCLTRTNASTYLLNRQYDVLNKLRKTLEKQHHNVQQAIRVLNHDVQLLTEQQEDLQHKMRHFAIVDSENFCKAWLTAEEECQSMAHSTLRVHHLLNEWVLGLPCVDVKTSCLENRGPFGKFVVPCSATSLVHRLLTTGEIMYQCDLVLFLFSMAPQQEFLVDSKLLGLLAPLPHTQQCLLKLDTIFKASPSYSPAHAPFSSSMCRIWTLRLSKAVPYFQTNTEGIKWSGRTANLTANSAHHTLFRNLQAEGAPVPPKWSQRDSSRDCLYWQSLADVVPSAQLRIWDVLTSTLHKYRNMLTYRLNLIKENATTQQQNEELQRLLTQYNMDKMLSTCVKITIHNHLFHSKGVVGLPF